MRTLTDVLAPYDIAAADDSLAAIEVPVLTTVQRQGDVLIHPAAPVTDRGVAVPAEGVPVVRGEATGNTHILTAADGPVFWSEAPRTSDRDLLIGTVTVPEGSTAYLIHTDEHGANGIGCGTFRLVGKREQAEEIRRVAD